MHINSSLFHHGFFDFKVPIVIVVTGFEKVEPTMNTWWINEACFTRARMSFNSLNGNGQAARYSALHIKWLGKGATLLFTIFQGAEFTESFF